MFLRGLTLVCALAAITATQTQEQTVLQNSRSSDMNFLQVSDGKCVDKDSCLRGVKVSVICKNGVCSVQDNSDDEDFELSFELSATGPDNNGCCGSESSSSSEPSESSSSEVPSESSSSEVPSESSSSEVPSESSSSEVPSESSSSEVPSESSSSEVPSESSSSEVPSESSSSSSPIVISSSSSHVNPSSSSSSVPGGCTDPYAKVVCEDGKCTQSDKDGNVLNTVDLHELEGDSCVDEFTLVVHCDSHGCTIQPQFQSPPAF